MTDPAPLRIAAVFDAVDDDGSPYFSADRRRVVDAAERESLIRYLEAAPIVLRASGFEADPLDPAAGRAVPLSYRTDGVWVWQDASAYYLRTRGCAPDDDLVAHITSRRFQAPSTVPDELSDAAAELALSTSPPPPATGRKAATYFASVSYPKYPAEAPKGLWRQWRNEQGWRVDESLPRDMIWSRTSAFIDIELGESDKEYEEIPPRLAARIADRWWADWRTDRPGS
ncbi:hypothetical protein ACQP00_40830 [Dactylosporangium sp. CS-047395]|uniref:hypothetical protein n=1 Tax=Dactylosporangium sp. CS-047395 TaxID=3239936 RepID=UPI003D911C9F